MRERRRENNERELCLSAETTGRTTLLVSNKFFQPLMQMQQGGSPLTEWVEWWNKDENTVSFSSQLIPSSCMTRYFSPTNVRTLEQRYFSSESTSNKYMLR